MVVWGRGRGQAVRKEAAAEMARSQGQGEEVLLVSELISSAAPRPSHGEDTVFEASLVPQKAEKGLENHPSPINQQSRAQSRRQDSSSCRMQDTSVAPIWGSEAKLSRKAGTQQTLSGGRGLS